MIQALDNSVFAAALAALGGGGIFALSRRSKGLPDAQRWAWRSRLFGAAFALWLVGLTVAAVLIIPALSQPRASLNLILVGVQTAFWFTAAAALAAIAVDSATISAKPIVPPRDRRLGFWQQQLMLAGAGLFGLVMYNLNIGNYIYLRAGVLVNGSACLLLLVWNIAWRLVAYHKRRSDGAV